MAPAATTALEVFAWFVLGYFMLLNSWYLVLLALAAYEAFSAARRAPFAGHNELSRSPLAPPISIIVPARDEEKTIVECVRGLLNLRYPDHEVVVIDDGSTDATFELMRAAFDLVEVRRVIRDEVRTIGRIRSTHVSRSGAHLLVVRKDGIGRPADAVNAGINAARNPLVCRVDADSYLDHDSLLAVAAPFIEDPLRVVAVAGSIRVANGSKVSHGRITEAHMPRRWIERIQTVEYLRSFLMGRAGWSRMQGMLFVSGAFGLFRRDVLVQIGGVDLESEGDDLELTTRIHHVLRKNKRPYRLAFIAGTCCWTEAPSTYRQLARQRRRWAHTLTESLWMHRTMICNPRYGVIGMLVLPYYVVFEMLGAFVELGAIVAFPLALALGVIDVKVALLFAVLGFGYATFLSLLTLYVEEASYHRYQSWRDLAVAALASVAENIGYRQLHAWWRVRGVTDVLRGRSGKWVDGPHPAATPHEAPLGTPLPVKPGV
jgi:cellulose synthase/poly-beta-1,6-N-acetylglucosamine synthase-like glycosyltransferase